MTRCARDACGAHHSGMNVTVGATGEARKVVTKELTAIAFGSGDVPVFGTPALLALIEEAACAALHGALDEGATSVGATVTLEHLAPSRIGSEVRAVARVTSVDGKRVAFEAEAYDGDRLIGRATHTRVAVDRARFSS